MTIDDSLIMFGSTSGLVMFFGSATVMPCCRNGVTTMKIISNTSMMSTIGVTLISDCSPPGPPPPDIPITNLLLLQAVNALVRRAARVEPHPEFTIPAFSYSLRLQLLRAVLNEVIDEL